VVVPEPGSGEPALEVRGLSVTYGGITAVSDVSIDVRPGELVGLIGPNGAGKTTTIDAITGFVPCRGFIRVAGTDLTGSSPHRRVRAGLARTWQAVELFEDLTVAEHLRVAAPSSGLRDLLSDLVRPRRGVRSGCRDVDRRILESLELAGVADEVVADLPHGTQKLVGVARALATDPSVLLLDEPAAGLDAEEGRAFGVRLRGLAADGLSIVLVDHDVELVMSTCDRVVVLDFGSVIASGTPERIRADRRVQEAYLGAPSPDPGRPS
jgi:ABC-type branched-subunit amino acid transport system ATPase component